LPVLDPRLNYKKLRRDYTEDPELLQYFENQKQALHAYFDEHYPATEPTTPSAHTPTNSANSNETRRGPINFAAFDQGPDDDANMDERDVNFEAPRILYLADLVQWWYARKAEYPRLYRFVRDILSIPGNFSSLMCKSMLGFNQALQLPCNAYSPVEEIPSRCGALV
jgi:hypothetical protein